MATEQNMFLRLAYQEMMNGGIQLKFLGGCGRSTERHRGVVLASKYGFQPVYCEMGTLSSHAGRWFDQIELQRRACL